MKRTSKHFTGNNSSSQGGTPALLFELESADFFISDLAHENPYRRKYGASYDPAEEWVDVTLQDYFDTINKDPIYSFNAMTWFDSYAFTRRADGKIIEVPVDQRTRQVQRFKVVESGRR